MEKYIFNYRYIERLETDNVVGDSVVEKRFSTVSDPQKGLLSYMEKRRERRR